VYPWFTPSGRFDLADAGYFAALLTFLAFFMKDSVRLRQVALASNVFYAIWAADIHLIPTLVLHLALFPVNCVRLVQLLRERNAIDRALAAAEIQPEWLIHFMARKRVAAGTVLFRRGDQADAVYFVSDGRLHLEELGIDLGAGSLLGEIGLFAPDGKRTQSVRALVPSTVYVLQREEALALYRRDPSFGIFLIRLITRRLVDDIALIAAAGSVNMAESVKSDESVRSDGAADDSPEAARA
jgi:CRP/FNR family cyclic AMP-dependent transcriptional regulator